KILAVYLLVLLLGISLSATIYIYGRAVRDTTVELVEQSLPQLQAIAALRGAILRERPILYEYYATVERKKFTDNFEINMRAIDHGLRSIGAAGNEHLAHIASDTDTIHDLAEQLDQTLSTNNIDWDKARELLQSITTLEESILPDLDALVELNQQQVEQGGAQVQSRTLWITGLVVVFSLFISGIAMWVGFYVNTYIAESAERKRLALFAERNPAPVMRLSSNGAVVYANSAAQTLCAHLALTGLHQLLPAGTAERIAQMRENGQEHWNSEYAAGAHILDCSMHLLRDLDTCHVYLSDITARKQAEHELEHRAYHDAITGLPNRRAFTARLASALQQESSHTDIAVVLMRLDHIKRVLESQGYETSDALLHAVAQRFNELLSHFDGALLFRFEGATFSVLLPGADSEQRVGLLAERLHACMTEPLHVEAREYVFTLSIGASQAPLHGHEVPILTTNAEAAVNHAQRLGGNGFQRYTVDMNARAQRWLTVESGLRRALERGEFLLNYQPQVSLESGQITGMEALIRWRTPDNKMIPPLDFIPIAEETGLIVPIGAWVLHTACAQARAWHEKGYSGLIIAVNISARQFQHPDFINLVQRTLRNTGLPADKLELEITESAVMQDAEKTIATLNALHALGVTLSIDDFGTGYSSLSYLKRFPLEKLKVDQSFVRNLTTSANDAAIARSVILLGHSLNLIVIAEGVETEAQLAWLRAQQCEEMQGYLFSRPVPAAEFEALLNSDKQLDGEFVKTRTG
ncbi:MAG: GGDEF domain-containing protein, partial [Gammaproteobacteria bacterium]|nr:GGDEF domain-containing protein [Gammaproteobacteria bacterium]